MKEIPVVLGFDPRRQIGTLRIDETQLPPTPDFVFALGYTTKGSGEGYELVAVSVVADSNYIRFLEDEARRDGAPL